MEKIIETNISLLNLKEQSKYLELVRVGPGFLGFKSESKKYFEKHFQNNTEALMLLVIDVINAGYEGVIVDEEPLNNGRSFQGLNVNLATPEGLLLQYISDVYAESGELPMTSNEVLKVLAMAYKLKGAKT